MSTLHRNVCSQKHCNGCGTCLNLTKMIPQQCLSCHFEVLVNFGQVFVLFLGAFIFDFEYSLFIVNVIKCCYMAYFCGTSNRCCYNYESCCKALVCKRANDQPYGVFFKYICQKVFITTSFLIFIILLQFPLGKLAQCQL